jgi:hypothetical protein
MRGRFPENFSGFRSTHETSIYFLQNRSSFKELCEVVDSNDALIRQHFRERFFGNPLPKSYKKLGKIPNRFRPFNSETLNVAINWSTMCVRAYKPQVALFLEYRSVFEEAFLIGDYATADKYLEKVENEICFSIWSLEARMLLLEITDSPEANKTFLSEINKTAEGLFIPSFAHYISSRSEKTLSVSRFDSDLGNAVQRIKGDSSSANREFYFMRLNRFEQDTYERLKDVLTFDGYHSVIDRYILLVKILKMTLSAEHVDPLTRMNSMERVDYLSSKFNDPELKSISVLLQPTASLKTESRLDLKILDIFEAGLYEECIDRLSVALPKNPTVIEYYVLYAKCFLLADLPFNYPNTGNCYQNFLLDGFYQFLRRRIDPNQAITNLQRLLKNLHFFSISDGIHKFLNDLAVDNLKWRRHGYFALSPNNPEILDFYDKDELRKNYLNLLSLMYPDSLSVEFKSIFFRADFQNQIRSLAIPALTRILEEAKFLYKQESFEEGLLILRDLVQHSKHIIPVYEAALENLFFGLVKTSQLDNAITLFVDTYLENNFLVTRMNVGMLHSRVRENKFRNVSASINLPLFYTVTNDNENEVHLSYEKLIKSLGIQKPSQLKVDEFLINKQKWIYFLRYTCTTDIFKHSIHIDGSKEGISERIKICQVLLSIDLDNEAVYKIEIEELTDALIIQEGIQQLDESKIYVNESGLMNFELRDAEGLFNRYKTISNIYRGANKKYLFIDTRRNNIRLASVEELTNALTDDREKYSNDPLRDAFEDIFDVITRKFLFSKFGISAYLSTRIRHGVLLGEVRPIFEKHNLISERDSSTGQYRPIRHWENAYGGFDVVVQRAVQDGLARFSMEVDAIILALLRDNLQIRMEEENQQGWFDYYFDETELSLHAIAAAKAKDFPEFIKRTIEILWTRTDQNLAKIRTQLQTEIKVKFNQAIENLTHDLQNVLHSGSPIFSSVNTCLTDVDNALNRIVGWFNRSGSQTSDFKLDKLIHIVLQNIRHSYPKRKLKVSQLDVTEITIKGEYYMHFADLFRIFFDNALKHSNQAVEIIDIKIIVEQASNVLTIIIKNANSNLLALDDLPQNSTSEINIRKLSTEGKSGFPKVHKIIKSDLKNETNAYHCSMDENGQFTVTLVLGLENLLA